MEGDDDKLGDSDCLPRLRTKWPRTYVYVLETRSYFAHVLTRRGVYSRAAFISLSASNCAAFIRGRRLFAEIRYSSSMQQCIPVVQRWHDSLPALLRLLAAFSLHYVF